MARKTTGSARKKATAKKATAKKAPAGEALASVEKSPETEDLPETEASDTAADPARIVKKLIQRFDAAVDKDNIKPTVGEFLRLMQVRKEIADEQPKEITVEWVDPRKRQKLSDK